MTVKTRRDRLAERLPALRAQLDEQRRFRLEQLAGLHTEPVAAGLAGTAIGPAADPDADPDAGPDAGPGVDPGHAEVDRLLRRSASWALTETEDALRRMDEGRYGRCEACHEPLGLDRLEVLPQARHCVACEVDQQG